MENTPEQEQDIAFSQAFMQEWVKKEPRQVLDHLKTLTEGYERLSKQLTRQEEQIARQTTLLAMQSELANAQTELLRKKDENLQDRVSLEFDVNGAYFVYAHGEEGDSFSVGATYQSSSLSGLQPTLETTPFSVAITLPYLKAIVRLLEVEGNRIPMMRSGSL